MLCPLSNQVGTSTYGPTGAAAGPTETKEVALPSGTEEGAALPFGRVPSGLVVAVAGLLIIRGQLL